MGWNKVTFTRKHPLINGLDNNSYFLLCTQLFRESVDQNLVLGKTNYLGNFTSILQKDYIFRDTISS